MSNTDYLMPIQYLFEYTDVPSEILYRKNDEALRTKGMNQLQSEKRPSLLCVGIGTYKTRKDGEIYLCILISPDSREILSYSLGVYRSPELVARALDILFQNGKFPLSLRSSRNPIYQKKEYEQILARYEVFQEMTEKGTCGGGSAVSTFFSLLMRKKGRLMFQSWQEAIDWLEEYINRYNSSRV